MFPLLYHTHHSLHNDDLRFWLELASHSAGPILELGCGTGRVLVPLLHAGHAVVGIDHDREMLTLLQVNLSPDMRSSLQVFQADFCAFHLQRKFGLILLPCNTYSALDADRRRQLLQCIRMHLLPGGLFAASLPNPRLLKASHRMRRPNLKRYLTIPWMANRCRSTARGRKPPRPCACTGITTTCCQMAASKEPAKRSFIF